MTRRRPLEIPAVRRALGLRSPSRAALGRCSCPPCRRADDSVRAARVAAAVARWPGLARVDVVEDQADVPALDEAEAVDLVNAPPHYRAHPSGVECIEITEHMGFALGNAVKYIWRADLKADALEDLRKAEWYIAREIDRRERP